MTKNQIAYKISIWKITQLIYIRIPLLDISDMQYTAQIKTMLPALPTPLITSSSTLYKIKNKSKNFIFTKYKVSNLVQTV